MKWRELIIDCLLLGLPILLDWLRGVKVERKEETPKGD